MVDDPKFRENALTTAGLLESGIALMRQNIRRRHPERSEKEVEALLRAWLWRTDDPVPGDTSGAVRVRERWT
jgi:hypothetical protein